VGSGVFLVAKHVEFSDIFAAASTTLEDLTKKVSGSYYSLFYKSSETYRKWRGGSLSSLVKMESVESGRIPDVTTHRRWRRFLGQLCPTQVEMSIGAAADEACLEGLRAA
jgi:hypothetical protein